MRTMFLFCLALAALAACAGPPEPEAASAVQAAVPALSEDAVDAAIKRLLDEKRRSGHGSSSPWQSLQDALQDVHDQLAERTREVKQILLRQQTVPPELLQEIAELRDRRSQLWWQILVEWTPGGPLPDLLTQGGGR